MGGRVAIAAGAHEITEEYVGRCDAFFTKTFTGLRQGASPLTGRRPPRQAAPQNGSSPPRRARGSKTLMFLRRQGSGKGCTLVLRGADLATLTKVKHVVQMVSTAAHNGRMETAFLVNMFSSEIADGTGEIKQGHVLLHKLCSLHQVQCCSTRRHLPTPLPANK